MTQNINFYQPALRKQATKFSVRAMAQAGALLTVAVLAIYGYQHVETSALRTQLRDAEQQRDAAARRLAEAMQHDASGDASGAEAARIARMEKDIDIYRRLQRMAQAEGLGNTAGYSGYFVAFARRNVPGMWLTRFEIGGHGESLLLEGRSTVPELVPRYLQSLGQDPAFSATGFRLFQIQRPESGESRGSDAYVEFRVGTAGAEGGVVKGAGS